MFHVEHRAELNVRAAKRNYWVLFRQDGVQEWGVLASGASGSGVVRIRYGFDNV